MRGCRAAVIGATGFLGSRLVAVLDASGYPLARFNRGNPPVVGGRPVAGLREADTVFFLAAGLNPALAERRPDRILTERVLFLEVLDSLAREGRHPVIALASSGGAVYASDAQPPYSESARTDPSSAYGRAKLRLEQELFGYGEFVRPVVLRLSNVYGPGQRSARGYGVLPHWLAAVAEDKPVRLYGDPRVARDYIHVDNVAEILAAVHRNVAAGLSARLPEILNVGSGIPTSLAKLLEIVSMVVGREIAVSFERPRHFDQPSNWLDTSLARVMLSWRPTIDLPAGIRQCWDHIRVERHALQARSRMSTWGDRER